MKALYFKKSIESIVVKCNSLLIICISLYLFSLITQVSPASAQAVLFDFDNAPLHSPLPISLTVSGITARFSDMPPGYSIQDNTAPVVPVGFTGRFIYPSSINLADLYIKYDQSITDFSIKYSCQELACDDAATMRVTACMNGSLVGTNTKCTSHPGTWPVDTLGCSFPQGFDSVVVHYDSHPPTCADYGVIYLADNMRVTASNATAIAEPKIFIERIIIPNPISKSESISFSLFQSENINVAVCDITGRLIKNLFEGSLNAGVHQVNWLLNDDIGNGLYFLNLTGDNFFRSFKIVVEKQ